MRFLCIWQPAKANASQAPSPDMMAKMNAFIEESTKNGSLISTGGRGPGTDHVAVTRENGEIHVVDGPFSEAKELVGGYALIEQPSLAAAIEMTKKFLQIAGDGTSEVYQMEY